MEKNYSRLVSVVFPVWNEEETLEALHTEVTQAVRILGFRYELVFVDNGSTDRSLEIVKLLAEQDPCVRYVSL
jgi:glycosyltransferase involved in cell wall biosynthesis